MAGARARSEAAKFWVDALLACPSCGGALVRDGASPHGVHRCAACGPYPRFAGVPVLVPRPSEWCASFREAVLASLAEVGEATAAAVEVVDAFAAGAPHAEARRFGDDWTAAESALTPGGSPLSPIRGEGQGEGKRWTAALSSLRKARGPSSWLVSKAPKSGTLLEVGCGAGHSSVAFAKRGARLVVGDLSLRAVLKARARVRAAGGDVEGVVLDAEALPFRARTLDAVVAENVVDLLEGPRDFLAAVKRVVKPRGRLLLTTPEPSLGTDDEDTLERLAKQAGLHVTSREDGLVWTRVHSPRFIEVYVARALELTAS
ncbi:MAG: class I SAM-dependent methyltransferase [Myxococcota bacterium]